MIFDLSVKEKVVQIWGYQTLKDSGFDFVRRTDWLFIGPNLTPEELKIVRRGIRMLSSEYIVFKDMHMSEDDYTAYLVEKNRPRIRAKALKNPETRAPTVTVCLITEYNTWL